MLAPNHKPHPKVENQPITPRDVRHWLTFLGGAAGALIAGCAFVLGFDVRLSVVEKCVSETHDDVKEMRQQLVDVKTQSTRTAAIVDQLNHRGEVSNLLPE